MKLSELGPLVTQYRTGLEAEMALLRRLDALSGQQREVSSSGELARLVAISEERERLMATLVAIEHGLKPVRQQLVAARTQLEDVVEFQHVVALHREAAELITEILSVDQRSMESLKEAEFARRTAAQTLEQGESTLAAYRRVVSPLLSSATLVNRRG